MPALEPHITTANAAWRSGAVLPHSQNCLQCRNAGAVALLVAHGADIDGHVTTRSGWMRPINAALCFPRSSEEQPALLEVLLEVRLEVHAGLIHLGLVMADAPLLAGWVSRSTHSPTHPFNPATTPHGKGKTATNHAGVQ